MPTTSGVYSLPPGYLAVSGQDIKASQHNPPLEDIAAALTGRLPRDGSAPMQANLPMNGKKVTGLGAGTSDSDAVRRDQVTLYSAFLSSIAGLAMVADRLIYSTGAGTAAVAPLTAFARSLLDDADAATMRTTLGLSAGALAAKATTGQAQAGVDDAAFMTALKTKQAIAAMHPSYTSPAQTITAAGTLTLTHGLGVVPTKTHGWLTNITADQGYSPGDRVPISLNYYGDVSYGVSVILKTNTLVLRFGSSAFAVLHATTGERQIADPAKWTFTVQVQP